MPIPKTEAVITVLGVDPGLATTGWGVVEGPGVAPRLIACGAIEVSARLCLPDRLARIHHDLHALMGRFHPGVLAVEELFFSKFARSIASTAQARGVILLTAAQHGVKVCELNPRAVKMASTGFGSAGKTQVQAMVQRVLGLAEIPKPDDAADAVAMALCYFQTVHSLVPPKVSKAAFERSMRQRAEAAV